MEDLTKELAVVDGDIQALETTISERIATFNNALSELRKKDTDLRAQIKEAMEKNDVKKFENDFVSISYRAPSTRKTFDSTAFKTDHPEVYEDYTKVSQVSGSVSIKVKEISNGN